MSYQVLARKWRPKQFTELVGQGHVKTALSNALTSSRLHHAYLFTGTRGVGKTTIARIFAKSLNCETGITATPCGVCSACQEIDAGNFVDLLEIDAASRTKVEDTRDLLDNVQYAPSRGRFKVYLIDEVHMLSRHSFNALLKTLEEPPASSIMFLVNHGSKPILPTIRSRCRTLRLNPLSTDDTAQVLNLADAPKEAMALARGRPGLGIRLSTPSGLQASNAARALLRSMPKPNDALLTAAVQAANADSTALQAFGEEVLNWLADRAGENPAAADAWLQTSRLLGQSEALNLEASQTAAKVIAGLYSSVGQG